MLKKLIFLASLLPGLSAIFAQDIFENPLSERITGYDINVSLDTDAKTISGSMVAMWVNNSPDMVPDLQLHMYLNAFRSNKSTFYRESGGSPGSREIDYGWTEISKITYNNGTDLSGSLSFIHPDDDNSDDMTVMQIMLPEPVAPGDTVFLDIDFTSKLPSNIRRTGFTDDFFFVGQWFPKFGGDAGSSR